MEGGAGCRQIPCCTNIGMGWPSGERQSSEHQIQGEERLGARYHDTRHHRTNPRKEDVEQEANGSPCLGNVRHTLPPRSGGRAISGEQRRGTSRENPQICCTCDAKSQERECQELGGGIPVSSGVAGPHLVSSQASVKTSITSSSLSKTATSGSQAQG